MSHPMLAVVLFYSSTAAFASNSNATLGSLPPRWFPSQDSSSLVRLSALLVVLSVACFAAGCGMGWCCATCSCRRMRAARNADEAAMLHERHEHISPYSCWVTPAASAQQHEAKPRALFIYGPQATPPSGLQGNLEPAYDMDALDVHAPADVDLDPAYDEVPGNAINMHMDGKGTPRTPLLERRGYREP